MTTQNNSENTQSNPSTDHTEIRQPLTPEQVDPQQKAEQREALRQNPNMTVNPGDRIDESKSLEEKAQQVAVDAPDITGDHIVVPTYFVVDEPDGSKKALHHIKDAEEISDVIRQARVDENGERTWS